MKIRVLKSDDKELINKVLTLTQISEMLWFCLELNTEIIDTDEELGLLDSWSKKDRCFEFYNLRIFYQEERSLVFIDAVKYLP